MADDKRDDGFASFSEAFSRSEASFKRFLLVGFSFGQRISNIDECNASLEAFLRKHVKEGLKVVYGGDKYVDDIVCISHAVKRLKIILERMELYSVQHKNYSNVDSFVDHSFIYGKDTEEVVFGGWNEISGPKGATAYYLGKLGYLLSGVICLGGGEIARQEVEYAVARNIPVGK
mmetsp:Transcript_11544/g.13977  ORF Transcript_11544/g.13977 Transcript_11544/m.13977 type:complete len:175 (+) Transcript_11544:252-776(+)